MDEGQGRRDMQMITNMMEVMPATLIDDTAGDRYRKRKRSRSRSRLLTRAAFNL